MEEFGCFSGRACFGSRCLGFLGHDNICGGISLTAQAGEIALFGIWGVGLSLGMFVAFPKCGKALCHEALSVTRAGECAVGGRCGQVFRHEILRGCGRLCRTVRQRFLGASISGDLRFLRVRLECDGA